MLANNDKTWIGGGGGRRRRREREMGYQNRHRWRYAVVASHKKRGRVDRFGIGETKEGINGVLRPPMMEIKCANRP